MAFSRDGEGDGNGLSLVTGAGVNGSAASGSVATPVPGHPAPSKLAQLKQEHRDLDEAIQALVEAGGPGGHDQLQLTRLKKRKLLLRDQITKLEDEILPDIIA